jgi:hypothetical protein
LGQQSQTHSVDKLNPLQIKDDMYTVPPEALEFVGQQRRFLAADLAGEPQFNSASRFGLGRNAQHEISLVSCVLSNLYANDKTSTWICFQVDVLAGFIINF